MPALRTADETAFTAVWIKFIRAVKSPVACGCFFCSANMNLVNVIGSTSIAGWHGGHDEVLILKRFGLFLRLWKKWIALFSCDFHLDLRTKPTSCPCQQDLIGLKQHTP
jgi:hypothetical protein